MVFFQLKVELLVIAEKLTIDGVKFLLFYSSILITINEFNHFVLLIINIPNEIKIDTNNLLLAAMLSPEVRRQQLPQLHST